MKKFLSIIILPFFFNLEVNANDIKKFEIEGISIGSSALNYFSLDQIENNEQDWFNYSYKEYSTSLLPGNGIYDWFQISYRSDDYNFIIEGIVGILIKKSCRETKKSGSK